MLKLQLINESEYSSLFLNEERHYPEFLDNIKETVSSCIFDSIDDMVKRHSFKEMFTIPIECDYADRITVDVTLNQNGDIHNSKEYGVYYMNTDSKLVNGKINNPKIIISMPIDGYKTDYMLTRYRIAHELTHLYDDWNAIRNGNGPLCTNPVNANTTSFIEWAIQLDNTIEQDLATLSYMSLKTEQQAFLSHTIQELETLGCTWANYKKFIDKTTLYKNVHLSYYSLLDKLKTANKSELERINRQIVTNFPNASIPKMKSIPFSQHVYKDKLLKWADRLHHNIMKRYGSVISYYIDKSKREHYKKFPSFITK